MNAKENLIRAIEEIEQETIEKLKLFAPGGGFIVAPDQGIPAPVENGVITGASALPDKWVEPLNDRVESYVVGYSDSRISDLARR